MVKLTKAQRIAVWRLYQRFPDGCTCYREFRRRVEPGPGCVMLPLSWIVIGIEPDGYAHS